MSVCILYLYIVYMYIYSVQVWNSHFSLPVCCSFHMFYDSCVHDAQWECILKGYKETSQGWICVLCSCLGFEKNFSDSKREVSGSLGCVNIGLFSWSHQGAFPLISLLFQVPTYTQPFCCLSVTHTWNASMAEIFKVTFVSLESIGGLFPVLWYEEGRTKWHSRSPFHGWSFL